MKHPCGKLSFDEVPPGEICVQQSDGPSEREVY